MGAFTHDGELYVPWDLEYVWRRLPNGIARLFLRTLWVFKDWHEQVPLDGRVVARVQGKRYRLNAVRVTDEALMAKFREHVSIAASGSVKNMSSMSRRNLRTRGLPYTGISPAETRLRRCSTHQPV